MDVYKPVKMPCFKCFDKKYIVTLPNNIKIPCPACQGTKNEAEQMPDYEDICPNKIHKDEIEMLQKTQQNINEKIVAMSPLLKRIEKLEQGNSILADGLLDQEKERLKLLERICKLENYSPQSNDQYFHGEIYKILEKIGKLEFATKNNSNSIGCVDSAYDTEIKNLQQRLLERDEHFDDRLNKLESEQKRNWQANTELSQRLIPLEEHKKNCINNLSKISEQIRKVEYECYKEHEKEPELEEVKDGDKEKLLAFVRWCDNYSDLNTRNRAHDLLLEIEGN